MPRVYACPRRWGDLDAQGHVNNAVFLDYLQEARVQFLLSGPSALHQLLDEGVLVVSHQVEYLAPVGYDPEPLIVRLWVDSVGGSRFGISYEVLDGERLAARARTTLVPFDLTAGRLRRLTREERELLSADCEPPAPLRALARVPITADNAQFGYPLQVRWSDLDSYGHANNVKFFDYLQEARIDWWHRTIGLPDGPFVVVARQDVEYRRPLDFRLQPYQVALAVSHVGNRSFTVEAAITDPASATAYATAATVLVTPAPLTAEARAALGALTTHRPC